MLYLTELYTALTQALLHRHMRGHPEYGTAIKCIDTLALSVSPKVHENLFKLCKLAYSGIVDQIQLIFRDLPSDFDDLGFMDSVTELYVTRGTVSSYNFLHLTFQEFLAAVHISTMSEEEQWKHFQRHKEGRLKIVLRFLAGLKKLSCFKRTKTQMFQTPSECEGDSSYVISCDVAVDIDLIHWMFEAQSDMVNELVQRCWTIKFYNDDLLLPLDCYSLGYCIVHSQCRWVLGICWGEERVRMLVAGASTKQETTAKVVGLHLLEEYISTECLNVLFTEWKSHLHLHQLSLRLPHQCDSILWPDLSTLRVLDIEFNRETKWNLNALLSHNSLESLTAHVYSDLVCVAIGDYIKSTACRLHELFITSVEPGMLWFVDEEEVEAITAALASNHSLQLEKLELKCKCEFTDTAAEDLAQFITNTTIPCYLTIEQCTITVHGLLVLDRVIQKNPITMNLRDLTIEMDDDNEAGELDQLLVKYPDMARCINYTGSGDDGAVALVKALHRSTTLQELHLYYSNISNDGAVALAQALYHNSTLEQLDLSNNSISDDGAVALAEALDHNSTLKQLDLSNNSISDDGAVALAQALHHNSTLKQLDLSNNSISDDGAVALAKALHHNSTLRRLDLSDNSISDDGAVALAQALPHISTLWKLDLSGNDGIDEEGTHQLVEAWTTVNTFIVGSSYGLILPRRCQEYAAQCAQYQSVKHRIRFH